jgi:3-oxoadipate enol-lactonase
MMRDVDSRPVAWREAGRGEVVVFLHGLGGSRTAWDPQLAVLADRWRCVAWDQPGYGASPPPDGPFTFAALADAAVRLLDALDVERAPLVGLSFGGMVALHAALDHPDRVAGLALLDTSPAFGGDGTDPDAWRAARLAPLDAGETPADMAAAVLTSVGGRALTGAALDTAVAAMARIPSDGLRAAIGCLPDHDVRQRLADITVPTLVLVGELDEETPPAYSRALADGIPGAGLEIVADAGHLSNLEQPEAVNRLLSRFLPTTFLSPTTRSRTR